MFENFRSGKREKVIFPLSSGERFVDCVEKLERGRTSDEQLNKFKHAAETEKLGEDLAFENREMKLRQMIIGEGSPFIGKTLIESGIRDHYSCMVIGLEEGKENLSSVSPNRRFQEGDIIWIVGEEKSLQALLNS